MKLNCKIFGLAVGALMGGMLVSCSNDLNEPGFNRPGTSDGSINVVRAPEFYAWSGNESFGNGTRANAGDGYIGNVTWEQFNTEKLENITDDERSAVLQAIAVRYTGSKISEKTVFPWENYFLQDVITMEDGSYTNAGNNGMKDVSVSNLEAFNYGKDCSPYSHHGTDYLNYEEVTNSKKMNQYFQKDNETRISQTTLMTGMKYGSYSDMQGRQFRVYSNCHIVAHYYDYITVNVDGNWYICFDFGCGNAENDKDGNPGRGATYNDWDYNDWIIKITAAVPTGQKAPDVWTEEPESGCNCGNGGQCTCGDECECEGCDHNTDTCPCPDGNCDCDHENGQCNCGNDDCNCNNGNSTEQPGNGGGSTGGNTNPNQPWTNYHTNEVEVNLSINDLHTAYDVEDLVSKLSIHVRYPGDVQVRIPVPAAYFIDADDLYILQDHDRFVYGGTYNKMENHTVTYNIAGEFVTLTVTYDMGLNEDGSNDPENPGCIIVTTCGINEKVYKYCRDNNGDGLNFEVYNYFCKREYVLNEYTNKYEWTNRVNLDWETELKPLLDESKVLFGTGTNDGVDFAEFSSEGPCPNYYIKAFGSEYDGTQNDTDCKVEIDVPQSDYYDLVGDNLTHLNGTSYNTIYRKKSAKETEDHAHHYTKPDSSTPNDGGNTQE